MVSGLLATRSTRSPWQGNANNSSNNNHIQRRNSRFFTTSSLHCELSPTHTLQRHGRIHVQIMCNTSSAHHVQYVVLRTMLYKGAAQLLNFDRVLSRIYFSFILLAEPLNL